MLPINDMCTHDSDVSLSHSFKDKSHYVKNGGHFCIMATKMADKLGWCIRQYFFWNLRPTKPLYRVNIEGSASLSFWDRRITFEMAAILLNGFHNVRYSGVVYFAIPFLKSTPHTTYIYTVKVEGSAPLSFWDSGHFVNGRHNRPMHNLAWHYS